jgi:glycosyltransferase involved in cell wall biosynthesis
MNEHNPAVSVLLPVHNGEKYLDQAIESILSQTFQDLELLVADDGSEDRTWQIASGYKDPRIRLFQNESNLGIAETLQGMILESRGKYIARMDADDISLPKRLEKQVAFLESHPKTGLLGTGIRKIINTGEMLKQTWLYPGGNPKLQWLLFFRNPFAHPTVMVRRELLVQVGGYRHRPAEDFDLWERLSWITGLDNLQEALVILRKHQSNLTVTKLDLLQRDSEEITLRRIEKWLEPTDIQYSPTKSDKKWPLGSNSMPEMAAVIDKLMNSFVSKYKLSKQQQAEIQSEAAKVVLKAAIQHDGKFREKIGGIRKAHQYDPQVAFRLAHNFFSNVKR